MDNNIHTSMIWPHIGNQNICNKGRPHDLHNIENWETFPYRVGEGGGIKQKTTNFDLEILKPHGGAQPTQFALLQGKYAF